MSETPIYIRICERDQLPDISSYAPFRSVVVLEADYSPEWQDAVSQWLVRCGCLYMMAWGPGCSSWDDSVDHAMRKQFEFNEVPDESFVMTTWHEKDSLEQVFWFAEFCAHDPYVELNSLIVHISRTDKEADMLGRYAEAQALE